MKVCCASGNTGEWLEKGDDLKEADRLEQAAAAWNRSGKKPDWLMEGERLAISEALAAKPGYRRRLEPVAEFLLCSRQRETERKEEEERQRQAELDAAQEKQRAAQEREKAAQEKQVTAEAFAAEQHVRPSGSRRTNQAKKTSQTTNGRSFSRRPSYRCRRLWFFQCRG